MKQLVTNACRLRVLVDAPPCRLVEGLAVGCKPDDIPIVTGGLAYLQAALMLGIVDAEHVNQLQFKRGEVFHRHSFQEIDVFDPLTLAPGLRVTGVPVLDETIRPVVPMDVVRATSLTRGYDFPAFTEKGHFRV